MRGSFAALRMTAKKSNGNGRGRGRGQGKGKGKGNSNSGCRSLHFASQRQERDASVEMTTLG